MGGVASLKNLLKILNGMNGMNGTFPISNDVMKLTFRGDMEHGLWNWCSGFGVENRNKDHDKSVIIILNFLK